MGICGGFQILGNEITDDQGYDGIPSNAKGLGLLDVQTIMGKEKNLGKKEFISTLLNCGLEKDQFSVSISNRKIVQGLIKELKITNQDQELKVIRAIDKNPVIGMTFIQGHHQHKKRLKQFIKSYKKTEKNDLIKSWKPSKKTMKVAYQNQSKMIVKDTKLVQ